MLAFMAAFIAFMAGADAAVFLAAFFLAAFIAFMVFMGAMAVESKIV